MEKLDFSEIFLRLLKYLIEGLIVGLVALFLFKKASWREVSILGITAAVIFLLLDTYSPSIGSAARWGAGLGIGSQIIGIKLA